MLIPRASFVPAVASDVAPVRFTALRAVARSVAVFVLTFLVSVGGLGVASYQNDVLNTPDSGPLLALPSPDPFSTAPLQYGIEVALSEPEYFASVLAAYQEAKTTFVVVDQVAMELAYFEEGSEVFRAPILAKGPKGSWWEVPAGRYAITSKREKRFSSFAGVYQPYTVTFQSNFFIHGVPYRYDGTPVPDDFVGGGIRLANEDAEAFYALVAADTPVLVHEVGVVNDDFLYEPKVPELETPHYLVADTKSTTILAASDLDTAVPIASVTKLMTALVAVEYINLDRDVTISYVPQVPSVIPRLQVGQTVSMYSLLQLLLVESSNEAAEYIAGVVGREKFIALMNEKAVALGLMNTTFTDPSGLDSGNVSSVGDLLRLAQYIEQNRSFLLELSVNQDVETVYKKGQFGRLENFNTIPGVPSFIGGKVGETLAAGQTSVSFHRVSVKGEERTIVIVILGSKNRVDDITELITYLRERFGGVE